MRFFNQEALFQNDWCGAASAPSVGDLQAWLALGNSYSEQKCFQEASHCYFSALVLDPSHDDAVFNYAAALIDLGQYEKAKFHLEHIGERTETVLRQIAFCDARMGL